MNADHPGAAGPGTRHGRHVARLAGRLFDGLAPVHGLVAGERPLLTTAACLHDLAGHGAGSHRRGADQLLDAVGGGAVPLPVGARSVGRPLDDRLVEIACLVRFQRGRPPGGFLPAFTSLARDRRAVVRVLAGLLRMADAMDAGRDGAVTGLLVQADGAARPGGPDQADPVGQQPGGLVVVHLIGEAAAAGTGEAAGARTDLAVHETRRVRGLAEEALGRRLIIRGLSRPRSEGTRSPSPPGPWPSAPGSLPSRSVSATAPPGGRG